MHCVGVVEVLIRAHSRHVVRVIVAVGGCVGVGDVILHHVANAIGIQIVGACRWRQERVVVIGVCIVVTDGVDVGCVVIAIITGIVSVERWGAAKTHVGARWWRVATQTQSARTVYRIL